MDRALDIDAAGLGEGVLGGGAAAQAPEIELETGRSAIHIVHEPVVISEQHLVPDLDRDSLDLGVVDQKLHVVLRDDMFFGRPRERREEGANEDKHECH